MTQKTRYFVLVVAVVAFVLAAVLHFNGLPMVAVGSVALVATALFGMFLFASDRACDAVVSVLTLGGL